MLLQDLEPEALQETNPWDAGSKLAVFVKQHTSSSTGTSYHYTVARALADCDMKPVDAVKAVLQSASYGA